MRKFAILICLVTLVAVLAVPGMATGTAIQESEDTMPWTNSKLDPERYASNFPEVRWVPIYVYAEDGWDPLAVRSWSDDGGDVRLLDMKPMEEDNWYQGLILCDSTKVQFDGTGGKNTTITLDIEPGRPAWFVINTGWDVELSYDPLTEHLSYYTVYVQAPEDWDSVHIWGWENYSYVDVFDSWPGLEMEYDAENVLAYTFRVPGWVDGLVFSNEDGSLQTEDIFVDGYDKWIRITDNVNGDGKLICDVGYYVPYEEPEETTPPTEPEQTTEQDLSQWREEMAPMIVVVAAVVGVITIIAAWIKQKKS